MAMECSWILPYLVSLLLLSFAFGILLSYRAMKKSNGRLPPGPPSIPFVGSIIWPKETLFDIEGTLRKLFSKYGPVITLHIGSRIAIFVKDHAFAHHALIRKGAFICDRIFDSSGHTISFARYGPIWRLLRRNLKSGILHPSRLELFAHDRQRILYILFHKIRFQAETCKGGVVLISECFNYALFTLQLLMCFGIELDEESVREIEEFQKHTISQLKNLAVFAFLPRITKLVFWKQWNALLAVRRKHEELFTPLVRRAQQEARKNMIYNSYLNSLLEIVIPEEGGRKLSEDEILSLCGEFVVSSTDSVAATLQWIMANLVRRQDIQAKLVEEMVKVVGKFREEIKEEDIERMPYLEAVVLEGLRRHPPAHFIPPHTATKEIKVGDFVVPKNAILNFRPMEMGRDGAMWEDPMEFRPERFLAGGEGEGVDITCCREIKMMPFSAGRRMCPGFGLAILHIKYFVSNLIWKFQWKAVDGEEIDMAEEPSIVVFMKNPLRACIVARTNGV